VVIVGVITIGVASIATGAFDEKADERPHPEVWDERVADLADFVEDARGLEFDHPVFVDFLTPEEYTSEITTEESDLETEDREELDQLAALLRALGLAEGEVDLFTAFNTVSDSGTLAFYSPEDARVRVRGTELTPGVRVTLVHELTHALQDQHFDLRKLVNEDLESGESVAHRALGEGDALRIEDRFVSEALSEEDQAAYAAEDEASNTEGRAAIADVPSYLVAGFGVPYALGRPFATMLDRRGGNHAVDDAFRSPPSNEEHLFDPASYLAGEEAEEVDLGLGDVDLIDDGVFAPSDWYLVLADRIDPKVAFDATLGWAGANYGTFDRDGRHCVRAVFAGDDADEEDEMRAALEAWLTAVPESLRTVAEVVDVDGHPGIDACDPGTEAKVLGADRADELLVLPAVNAYLQADAATVLDPLATRCYAREVMATFTTEELLDPDGAIFASQQFERAAFTAIQTCRG
jgi:hypothetical protein